MFGIQGERADLQAVLDAAKRDAAAARKAAAQGAADARRNEEHLAVQTRLLGLAESRATAAEATASGEASLRDGLQADVEAAAAAALAARHAELEATSSETAAQLQVRRVRGDPPMRTEIVCLQVPRCDLCCCESKRLSSVSGCQNERFASVIGEITLFAAPCRLHARIHSRAGESDSGGGSSWPRSAARLQAGQHAARAGARASHAGRSRGARGRV
jgi:hypothetical protein